VSLDPQWLKDVSSAVISVGRALGAFDKVNGHEPKNAPGRGLTLSYWLDRVRPCTRGNGLASTSANVVWLARVQLPGTYDPADEVDPILGVSAGKLINAYAGNLTMGGAVLPGIDLRGIEGVKLEGRYGYVTQEQKQFRMFDMTVPVLVNDVWSEAQ
jgi:hypothetical protein